MPYKNPSCEICYYRFNCPNIYKRRDIVFNQPIKDIKGMADMYKIVAQKCSYYCYEADDLQRWAIWTWYEQRKNK